MQKSTRMENALSLSNTRSSLDCAHQWTNASSPRKQWIWWTEPNLLYVYVYRCAPVHSFPHAAYLSLSVAHFILFIKQFYEVASKMTRIEIFRAHSAIEKKFLCQRLNVFHNPNGSVSVAMSSSSSSARVDAALLYSTFNSSPHKFTWSNSN